MTESFRILQFRESHLFCLSPWTLIRDVIGNACEDRGIDQSRIGVQNRVRERASETMAHEGNLGGRGTEFTGPNNLDEFLDDSGVDGRLRNIARYTEQR